MTIEHPSEVSHRERVSLMGHLGYYLHVKRLFHVDMGIEIVIVPPLVNETCQPNSILKSSSYIVD